MITSIRSSLNPVLEPNSKHNWESPTHWAIYEKRSDIKAICHVNAGPKDDKNITVSTEEIPYGTTDLGYDTAKMLQQVDVVMMKNHGMMIVGHTLSEVINLTIDSADRNKPYVFVPGQKTD